MSGFTSPGLDRLRRRTFVRRVVVIAVLLVILVLSALLWPRQRAGALAVPTIDSEVRATGVLSGRLDAERTGDRICFAVRDGAERALLVFPQGYGANEESGLLDPTGVVIAPKDAPVRVIGRPGRISTLTGCTGTGRIWEVSAVRSAR